MLSSWEKKSLSEVVNVESMESELKYYRKKKKEKKKKKMLFEILFQNIFLKFPSVLPNS